MKNNRKNWNKRYFNAENQRKYLHSVAPHEAVVSQEKVLQSDTTHYGVEQSNSPPVTPAPRHNTHYEKTRFNAKKAKKSSLNSARARYPHGKNLDTDEQPPLHIDHNNHTRQTRRLQSRTDSSNEHPSIAQNDKLNRHNAFNRHKLSRQKASRSSAHAFAAQAIPLPHEVRHKKLSTVLPNRSSRSRGVEQPLWTVSPTQLDFGTHSYAEVNAMCVTIVSTTRQELRLYAQIIGSAPESRSSFVLYNTPPQYNTSDITSVRQHKFGHRRRIKFHKPGETYRLWVGFQAVGYEITDGLRPYAASLCISSCKGKSLH